MKKEYWRPVVEYEGLYMVSNWGRVKSMNYNHSGKEKILKPGKDKNGYLKVGLCKNGKVKTFYVHKLVAEAFLLNPNNLPCINHKDENKQNNSVNNLEWCSYSYNINFGTRNKRMAKKNTNGKRSKSVLQYDLEGNFVREWESTAECGRNGFIQQAVVACCKGKRKKHKGFIFKYK